jgi:hypothetical protein
LNPILFLIRDLDQSIYRGKRLIARDVGDANHNAWFVDDESDEDGSLIVLSQLEATS